ncbi:MAG: DUF1501 domain-containing protein [Gammaproteobacteria bacterium]|nr:DUF1501 domain-containing protein [Gammaproteobacteria bacterium]
MASRRDILRSIMVASAACVAPGLTVAATSSSKRFVLVVLRGAVDGLALAAPYADSNYEAVRGELAIDKPGNPDGLLQLDGFFGLNPSLQNVHRYFQSGDAAIVHAVASPYRERSHFDGQDMLENGATRVGGKRDGWLNRAMAPMRSTLGNEAAVALAQNTPLVLRGENSVTSWAPSKLPDADDATLARLQQLYADDAFFATRLEQALRSQEIAGNMGSTGTRGNEAKQFIDLMASAAKFLTTSDGPNIAVVELGGWDTHANQGASSGALANRFSSLDTGLGELKDGLGERWHDTAVAVVTEFGRTVRVNGTRGTDHGTGTAAVLLGGAVNGGRVIADWPGLSQADLFAGRDLLPTSDVRSVFKGLLVDHLELAPAFVEREVFPGSQAARTMQNLIKS